MSETMQLKDSDPMPWGMHSGTPIGEVPASYLHYVWTNGKQSDMRCPVADYIRRNLASLKMDHPDGIWF
jgi:hypothetical protein